MSTDRQYTKTDKSNYIWCANFPRHGKTIPSEFHTWSVITITGSCVGFMFGGVIGARNAADAHIERTKLIVYDHGFQAQREMHSASIRGFIRMGSRWGWRIGIFASLFR